LSKARAFHASAAAHGKLYVFGGFTSSGDCMDLVEVYSPASNSWARAADMPSAIDEVVAVAL
jgi:N-acetylneuraminic acid mutarotase